MESGSFYLPNVPYNYRNSNYSKVTSKSNCRLLSYCIYRTAQGTIVRKEIASNARARPAPSVRSVVNKK